MILLKMFAMADKRKIQRPKFVTADLTKEYNNNPCNMYIGVTIS